MIFLSVKAIIESLPRMTTLSTEDFPYTIGYVQELLALDEMRLMQLVRGLGLSPAKDDRTGSYIFTHKEIDLLKRAQEMTARGENMDAIAARLGLAKAPRGEGAIATRPAGGQAVYAPSQQKDSLAVMLESMSQIKEGLLKDLARLVDDKLSGLDDLVVELIRCKSENDSLKKKLEEAVRARESMEYELSLFKPVQFGFYKKESGSRRR